MIRHPPISPLFPYTTLFRSATTAGTSASSTTNAASTSAGTSATGSTGAGTSGTTTAGTSTSGTSSTLPPTGRPGDPRSEEHTSELQSQSNLVCRLLLEKKQL